MKLLSLLLLLASSLPSLGQIWGDFADFTYLHQRSAAAAAGCTESNLFLHIDTPLGSSSTIPDGAFMSQKIKNLSDVQVTIKRLTWPIQTNDAAGPPTWTAYVRDNPDFGAGTTYGSASISTNRSRTGVAYADFIWAAGTEPTVPAATDFYIGVKVAENGASTAQPYDAVAGGTYYVDTSYRAYEDGADFGGVTTRDIGMDIWGCYDRPSCTDSNLWSSPINQQQLVTNNDRNMTFGAGVLYGQRIRNTSGSTVMIKKLSIGLQSSGVTTDARAACTSSGSYQIGNQYGYFSQVVSIPAGMPAQLVDFVWDAGYEPIIPPNTDFMIGVFPFANNQMRINLNSAGGGTSYETTSWNYQVGDSADTFDVQFELYICQ